MEQNTCKQPSEENHGRKNISELMNCLLGAAGDSRLSGGIPGVKMCTVCQVFLCIIPEGVVGT
jgi:hypothetical protein